MKFKKNNSFNDFFNRLIEVTPITTQNGLARELGVNRSSITQAKRLDQIPDKWLLHLFRRFNLNPDWLEFGQGPPFVERAACDDLTKKHIPKVKARLCAGNGSFETDDSIAGHFFFDINWLKKKGVPDQMVLVDIFGDSMAPELKGGDTVLIDMTQTSIIAGAIYAIGVDDTIMVKRLEKQPGKLVLRSDNPNYDPIYLDKSQITGIRVIGKVIWACRNLR